MTTNPFPHLAAVLHMLLPVWLASEGLKCNAQGHGARATTSLFDPRMVAARSHRATALPNASHKQHPSLDSLYNHLFFSFFELEGQWLRTAKPSDGQSEGLSRNCLRQHGYGAMDSYKETKSYILVLVEFGPALRPKLGPGPLRTTPA